MVETSQRAAYLRALGIDQWQPRAQPLVAATESSTLTSLETEYSVSSQETVPVHSTEPLVVEAAEVFTPRREHLQDNNVYELLERAAVNWYKPPQVGTSLAVLGLDARASLLSEASFDQDHGTLLKMLAAIGCDLSQSALGGLHWQAPPSSLLASSLLVLVDSGEDQACLIQNWRDKTLQIQGATVVIAPHPCMFLQGTSIKRQAWNGLQLLQKSWVA